MDDSTSTKPSAGLAAPKSTGPEARLERLVRSLRRFTPDDRDALRAFQLRQYGERARQLEADRFRWLFEENPAGSEAEPEVWLCDRDGIVGQQSGILHRLKLGGDEVRASWAVDLMVDPAWRLRGVGPALSERHARSHPVAIALGATDALHPVLLRAGWTDLGNIPTLVRPLRPDKLEPWWRLRGAKSRLAVRLASPLFRAADGLGRMERRGIRLEPITAFDERLDEVWRQSSSAYPVLTRRDARALAWRFDRSPDAPLYRRFLILRRDRPAGYFVLREGALLGAPVCFLVDYLCRPALTGALLGLIVEAVRPTGAGAVVCDTLNLRAARVFTRGGYLAIHKHNPRRFLWRAQADLAPHFGCMKNRANWFITRADGDWDQPEAED